MIVWIKVAPFFNQALLQVVDNILQILPIPRTQRDSDLINLTATALANMSLDSDVTKR